MSRHDRGAQLFVRRTRQSRLEDRGQRRSARKKETRASRPGRCNLPWYCLMRFAGGYCFVRRNHEVTQLRRRRCTDSPLTAAGPSLLLRGAPGRHSPGHKSGCRPSWRTDPPGLSGARGRFLNEREIERGGGIKRERESGFLIPATFLRVLAIFLRFSPRCYQRETSQKREEGKE